MVFKAIRLDEITQGGSTDKKQKLDGALGALQCRKEIGENQVPVMPQKPR